MATVQFWAPELPEASAPSIDISPVRAEVSADFGVELQGLTSPLGIGVEPGLEEIFKSPPRERPSLLSREGLKYALFEVETDVLTKNLKEVLSDFQGMMNELSKPASGFCIDEIELNLGISGKGGVALIGKLDVGVDATIKVRIKRAS